MMWCVFFHVNEKQSHRFVLEESCDQLMSVCAVSVGEMKYQDTSLSPADYNRINQDGFTAEQKRNSINHQSPFNV